ncbi:PAS domain S-box-containing protein/diguanylate cyclase (GGDEF)-like protein [Paucimonas lemoignei]|uniref:PAS domain S-box-containing protein/diguanylate cyclase (GGDEF)-like protein n=1 Tax=Paucimonas lemoignei TaxID=29443 RepID=A0A4R3HTS8_PAULE|nr:PAS domain S-box protein [Paucimonas lemoignei]TCS36606.1 PAS domain S-box-containing protein/diguanylate cyclase (GGDEF)-like protein [Paucimonas lemoignei]
MHLLPEVSQDSQLYRLILDNALDAFVAIDEHSLILEWSQQAEHLFGWKRHEVLGRPLTDTIIPKRYRDAHLKGMQRYLHTGEQKMSGRRVEVPACRKDGSEFPAELAITPIRQDGHILFSASLRDLSRSKALEQRFNQHAGLTRAILDCMPDAVAVADMSGKLILVNPAAQRLLNLPPTDAKPDQTYHQYSLLHPDTHVPFTDSQRPMVRALHGEHVQGIHALVRHENLSEDGWVSINARPLTDDDGNPIGGIVVLHDISELRRRENELRQQAHVLHKRVSLLELSHDAIITSDMDDIITFWNHRAENLYGISREEALGCNYNELLQTSYPIPLAEIKAIVHEQRRWQGEVRQRARDDREIIVLSQWALELKEGIPWRYLQTHTDITQTVRTERALRESQENYRLLVETTIDFAIVVMDRDGAITSWNPGAEQILGMPAQEAIGRSMEDFFTPEDRDTGRIRQEMHSAEKAGRAEDVRWHMRKDGTRFWANGVMMPLRNEDGSLRGFVKVMRDQTAARLAEEQTQFLANHDMLTGLANRVHFSNQLHHAIAHSERTHIPLAVLMMDLDRFKYVNDTFGHHVGDLLLKEVSTRILSTVRETDTVARLGGDEFIVIQTNATQPAAAMTLAKKLVHELSRPYQLEGNEIIIGTSIGISSFPTDAKNAVDLVKHADLALYQAKSAGRGTFKCYTVALSEEKDWKKNREQALREALERKKFSLYYQPQIDLTSWKITTVEALLRWQPDEMEMVLPGEFLDLAEESGLIVKIGEWALRQACRQAKQWLDKGMSPMRISLNCSARQFSDPEFVGSILPVLSETGLDPSCLELEVTASLFATHPQIKEQLVRLRNEGVHIIIDNYGTGTVALIDLKEFEVDGLKIDKAFVQHLPHRRQDSAIATAIISLAHELGIHVSAGGVETAEQLAYLKARDCTSVQGFLFSPPVPAEKFEQLMLSGHWSRINRMPQMNDSSTFKDLH